MRTRELLKEFGIGSRAKVYVQVNHVFESVATTHDLLSEVKENMKPGRQIVVIVADAPKKSAKK